GVGPNVRIGSVSHPMEQLALSATGSVSVSSSARIDAKSISLSAPSIGIGDASSGTSTAAPLPTAIVAALTGANTSSLTLRALSGSIDLYESLDPGKTLQNLTLDAPSLVGHGSDITIASAGTVTLVDSGAGSPSAPPASTGSTLTVDSR